MIRLLTHVAAVTILFAAPPFGSVAHAHKDLYAKITCVQKGRKGQVGGYTYVITTSGQRKVDGTVTGPKHAIAFTAAYQHEDGVIEISTLANLHGVLKDQAPYLTGVQLFRLEWKNDRRNTKAWTLTFLGFPSPVAADRTLECNE